MQFQTVLTVYQAIVKLSPTGQADLLQDEIAEQAGLSLRHTIRALNVLKKENWLQIGRGRSRYGRQEKNRYTPLVILTQSDMVSHSGGFQNDSVSHSGNALYSTEKNQNDSVSHTCMNDDDDLKNNRKRLWHLLDFLHEGERRKRSREKHCTLTFAQKWREWWDRAEFGTLENPAGWANLQMRQGIEPPQQMPLPGGALPVEPVQSWFTVDEENLIER